MGIAVVQLSPPRPPRAVVLATASLCTQLLLTSCASPRAQAIAVASPTSIEVTLSSTPALSTESQPSAFPTAKAIGTPLTPVRSLEATVSVDLLSCRYGPGADYLFLYGLRGGAHIQLIGRTDDEHWRWVYVAGRSPCWLNAEFVRVEGDWRRLPVVYPGQAKLPVSPYYRYPTVTKATRQGDNVAIQWIDVPLRPGDEEDPFMRHYILEVWRCQGGQLLFEPLATDDSSAEVLDQPGCSEPSHGRLFLQEKHGFAGPTEIPWPVFK